MEINSNSNVLSLLVYVLLLFLNDVHAQINVIPKIMEIEGVKNYVKIINESDRTEFVNVNLYMINNPGVQVINEKLTSIGDIKKPSIFATPFKLTIGPNQEKLIKIEVLNDVNSEVLYRLSVTPQIRIDNMKLNSNILIINVGYNILVRHSPKVKIPRWYYECINDSVNISATGNSRSEFRNIKSKGIENEEFNLYPGTNITLKSREINGFVNNKRIHIKCQ